MPPGSSRRSASSIPRGRGDDRRPDRIAVGVGAEHVRLRATILARVDRDDVVAAPAQHLDPQLPDRAATDDEHAPARHALGGAQHARERLDPDAVVLLEAVRQRDAMCRAQRLGKAAGRDPQLAKLAAGRLMAREAPLACPARDAVHDGDARAVLELARDLVTEHAAGGGAAELLDVRAAQPAGAHAHEQPGPGRLR